MKWHNALAVLAFTACNSQAAPTGGLPDALLACQRGAAHAEIHIAGDVVRVLGVRHGPSGAHEGFTVASNVPKSRLLPNVRIEDNIDITGYIPLRAGDHVELEGQYECNDGVVHWTHRDPAGRHVSGYVNVNGRTYQ